LKTTDNKIVIIKSEKPVSYRELYILSTQKFIYHCWKYNQRCHLLYNLSHNYKKFMPERNKNGNFKKYLDFNVLKNKTMKFCWAIGQYWFYHLKMIILDKNYEKMRLICV
jgi:hypothetical protein